MNLADETTMLLRIRMMQTFGYTLGTRFSMEQSLRKGTTLDGKESIKAKISVHLPASSLTVLKLSVNVFDNKVIVVSGNQYEGLVPITCDYEKLALVRIDDIFDDFEKELEHLTRFSRK